MVTVNDQFPTNVTLKYIPYTKENAGITACANPIGLDLSKFADAKIIVTAAPGAFTPTCTENHIPDYLKHADDFKAKGIERVIVLTANDPFVNAAWAKAIGYNDESNYFVFATDPNTELSSQLGEDFTEDLRSAGFGLRTARYAAIVDKGKITFLQGEKELAYTDKSSAQTILERL